MSLDAPADAEHLRSLVAKRLGVPLLCVESVFVSRRSVDARDKSDVHFALTLDARLCDVDDERPLIRRFRPNEAAFFPEEESPLFGFGERWPEERGTPVVIGAGPAGLFCALALALRGARPILLERGRPVDERARSVLALETGGGLDPESNVLFGEGGAGAFSDGKLTCGLDNARVRRVLRLLRHYGAPEDILSDAKPHIGTDLLRGVLKNLRAALEDFGAQVRFGWRADGLVTESGEVRAVRATHTASGSREVLPTRAVYLAIGHSARDTYQWLCAMGVPMERKPFAAGVRIEHRQAAIDRAQYGAAAGHPALPPADYKLNVKTPDGRGAYTFCMCPGGRVINASSEEGLLNVNGMSLHARDGENANAALLVGVKPEDFGGEGPLAGVEWQRALERAAFQAGGGGYRAPCQRVADFLAGKPSTSAGSVTPSYLPGVTFGDVAALLPAFLRDDLKLALPLMGQRLRGFADGAALLTGVETRSSAPVRILRDARGESALRGLYPLGEGAGYAGGIVSAAADGLRAGLEEGGGRDD